MYIGLGNAKLTVGPYVPGSPGGTPTTPATPGTPTREQAFQRLVQSGYQRTRLKPFALPGTKPTSGPGASAGPAAAAGPTAAPARDVSVQVGMRYVPAPAQTQPWVADEDDKVLDPEIGEEEPKPKRKVPAWVWAVLAIGGAYLLSKR